MLQENNSDSWQTITSSMYRQITIGNKYATLFHSPYYVSFLSIIAFWMMLAHFLGTNPVLESIHLSVLYKKKKKKKKKPKNKNQKKKKKKVYKSSPN